MSDLWKAKFKRLELILDEQYALKFDWTTDGCSGVPDSILGIKLTLPNGNGACPEHDFYYRNFKRIKLLTKKITKPQADRRLFSTVRIAVKTKFGFKGVILASGFWLIVSSPLGYIAWNNQRKKENKYMGHKAGWRSWLN